MVYGTNQTVALICAFVAPSFGGVPTTLGLLIREYLRASIRVVVAAPTPKPHDPVYKSVIWLETETISTARCALNALIDYNQGTWDAVQAVMRHAGESLAALLAPHNPSVINSHTEHFIGDMISEQLGIPHVITLHGYPPDAVDFQIADRPNNPRMEFPRSIIRNALPTTTITTVSHFTRRRWLRSGVAPDKIEVIYNPVEMDLFRRDLTIQNDLRTALDIASHELLLLCPQRTKRFGMDTVVFAFHRLCERQHNLKLLFCDSDLTSELCNLVQTLGIQDRVITRSFAYETMPQVYAASNIVILPDTLENFGIPCIEALSVGRPVIASRSGSFVELLCDGETALLFNPCDVDELVTNLERLISDLSLRARLSNIPKDELIHFTPMKIATQYLSAYQRAITAYAGVLLRTLESDTPI